MKGALDMERLPTGNDALDLVLGGGLPVGSLIVLAGAPGTGKTILAQQICFANATPEKKAIYYTTWSEPHEKLARHLSPFGFFDPKTLGHAVEFIHLADLTNTIADSAGLGEVAAEVVRKSFEARPAIVVIDSSKALHDVAGERGFRKAIYDLASQIGYSNAVLLFVGEYTEEEIDDAAEFAVADGIVCLTNEPVGAMDRRWLRILKMRGSSPLTGKHSFQIGPTGFELFPRFEAVRPDVAPALEGRISIGVRGIDDLIGGGIPAGDSTLLAGPSGVGKTVLALSFIAAGLAEGERCLYVSFQEDDRQLLEKAGSFGMKLKPAYESGQFAIRHIPLAEVNLDAVGATVRAEMGNRSFGRFVIDSLAELEVAAPEASRFPAFVWALTGFSRAMGATALVTNETSTRSPLTIPVADFSFLFQNTLILRYLELGTETGRALSILKMRNSDHAKGSVRYDIDKRGIQITPTHD